MVVVLQAVVFVASAMNKIRVFTTDAKVLKTLLNIKSPHSIATKTIYKMSNVQGSKNKYDKFYN